MSPPQFQFNDQNAKRESNPFSPSSTSLKINKDSHLIKKSSSSSSSFLNGVACVANMSSQPRHPVIIHTRPPKVIRTNPHDFMALVQKLTGFSSPSEEDQSISLCQQQQPKSETNNYHEFCEDNNKNGKRGLISDDNESTSAAADQNNSSLSDPHQEAMEVEESSPLSASDASHEVPSNAPRAFKKYKRKALEPLQPTAKFVFTAGHTDVEKTSTQMTAEWTGTPLGEIFKEVKERPPIYIGEDDNEWEDCTDMEDRSAQTITNTTGAKGKPTMTIHENTCHRLSKPWRRTLIIKLLGRPISFKSLQQQLRELWKLEWESELIDLAEDYFLARFYTKADYIHVLNDGPWLIFGNYLNIARWSAEFQPSHDVISSSLVWVRFPELPIQFFNEEILFQLGGLLGTATKVDDTTLMAKRGKYARVCVEINLSAPLIPSIELQGHDQRVEYEGLHVICFQCGKYGHLEDECSVVPTTAQPIDEPNLFGHATPTFRDVVAKKNLSPYGPWMLPPKPFQRRPLAEQQREKFSKPNKANHKNFENFFAPAQDLSAENQRLVNEKRQTMWRPKNLVTNHQSRLAGITKSCAFAQRLQGDQSGSRFALLRDLTDKDSNDLMEAEFPFLQEKLKAVPGVPTLLMGLERGKSIKKSQSMHNLEPNQIAKNKGEDKQQSTPIPNPTVKTLSHKETNIQVASKNMQIPPVEQHIHHRNKVNDIPQKSCTLVNQDYDSGTPISIDSLLLNQVNMNVNLDTNMNKNSMGVYCNLKEKMWLGVTI